VSGPRGPERARAPADEAGDPDAATDAALAALCRAEDHRLCLPEHCQHTREVYATVLAAAGPVLATSGRRFAVLCAVPQCTREHGGPRLLLCTDTRTAATSARNSHYRTAHDGYTLRGVPSVHGWVPIVRAEPGGLLID
jgi:hypothetical protein